MPLSLFLLVLTTGQGDICSSGLNQSTKMLQPCSAKTQNKRGKDEEWVTDGKRSKMDVEETPTVTLIEDQHQEISLPPAVQKAKKPRVTFVLDQAAVKLGIVRKTTTVLNVNEHSQLLLHPKKNLDDFRPDILHRALIAIIDSPFLKSGMVQAIFVKIDNGVLFEVNPQTRLPRTPRRFYGLMLKLLQKSKVSSEDKSEKLLRVIEQPVTRHLPANSRVIGLSYSSEKLVDLDNYVTHVSDDVNLVFVVGVMVHGMIDKTYADDFISVSNYRMSASKTVGRICNALEERWNII